MTHVDLTRFASRLSALSLICVLALALFMAPPISAQSANAMVRVAHASPDAPNVDVYLGNTKALSNVPFEAVSNYLTVPAGSYPVKVLPAGAPATDKGVIEANVTVEAGRAYTIAAMGKVASIGPAVLSDNLAAPAAGKAKVRLVHASPDAPAVDIAVKGGPVIIPNTAFKAASAYIEVAAGRYDLEVRPAGQSAVALAVPGVTLEAGMTYSVFALGLLQGTPALKAKAVVDAAPSAPAMPRTGAGGLATPDAGWSLVVLPLGLSALVISLVVLRRRERRS